MTKINISIPKPCHEDWQAMTPENKGRFCDSCQKKVFDFTASSDREIINAFKKDNNLCGRFLTSQLDRDLVKPKEKSTIWLATTTALISLIGLNETTAQQKAPTEQTDRRALGKFMVTEPKEIIVKGHVVDEDGVGLAEVLIRVKNKANVIYTDNDGSFSAKISKGDTLLFSKKGYYTDEEYTFDNDRGHLNIVLSEYALIKTKYQCFTVGGAVETVVSAKKRTFLGRIFHSIGNLFR